ncbi:MAG: hypothetical protein ACON39_00900 [Coraliomargaritaceae bacterium]
MRTRVIWDHGEVRIWRLGKSAVECAAVGQAEDAEGLVLFLQTNYGLLVGSRLTLLLDHPLLDHRLERIPKMKKKLQRQLLEQRQQKTYGAEARHWSALALHPEEAGSQDVRLLASFPAGLNGPIANWALRAGIYLEGIFSLPAALAVATPEESSAEGSIIPVSVGEITYLVARNPAGKLLFFVRAGNCDEDAAVLERSAGRLALFIEQEFGLSPVLQESFSEAEVPVELFALPTKSMLNLCALRERRRQAMLRFRVRAFSLLVVLLLLSFLQIQPSLAKKQELESKQLSLLPEIRSQRIEMEKAQAALAEERTLRQIVAFCRNRLTEKLDDPVPSPLPVLVAGVGDALPPDLELDRIECGIDADTESLRVVLRGRPLSPDLDLASQLERFKDSLSNQGWSIESSQIDFVQEGSGNSRFTRRGAQRFFEMEIAIRPRLVDTQTL